MKKQKRGDENISKYDNRQWDGSEQFPRRYGLGPLKAIVRRRWPSRRNADPRGSGQMAIHDHVPSYAPPPGGLNGTASSRSRCSCATFSCKRKASRTFVSMCIDAVPELHRVHAQLDPQLTSVVNGASPAWILIPNLHPSLFLPSALLSLPLACPRRLRVLSPPLGTRHDPSLRNNTERAPT